MYPTGTNNNGAGAWFRYSMRTESLRVIVSGTTGWMRRSLWFQFETWGNSGPEAVFRAFNRYDRERCRLGQHRARR